MKSTKLYVISIIALNMMFLLFLFTACSNRNPDNEPFNTTINGQVVTIQFNDGTTSEGIIKSDKGEYAFSYPFSDTFSVIYPNGYAYSHKSLNGAIAASSGSYDSTEALGYIGGISLEMAVQSAARLKSANQRIVSPFVSILLLGIGIFSIISPRSLWWLSRGWMYKNVEPSDLALVIYRVSGVIVVLFGIVSFFA